MSRYYALKAGLLADRPTAVGGMRMLYVSIDVPAEARFFLSRSSGEAGWDEIEDEAGAGGDHATSHQNGGGDEINVAGLSGVLADPQPPIIGSGAAQAVAGNDARLTDARTPTAHNHDTLYYTEGEVDTLFSNHNAAADPHTGYQKESEKGAALGYASLGADGLVPSAQLPVSSGLSLAEARKVSTLRGL